jgi:uncharacterized protein
MAKISLREKYGQNALVAGASKGIGAAFSEYLAAEGMDLILIARNKLELDNLANILIENYKIKVFCIYCDLSDLNAAKQISSEVKHLKVSLLVYNAAISYIGPFEKNSMEQNLRIAQANMITPMSMVQLFCDGMLESGRGAMILMSSLAGFQGSGFLATYASSKAFNMIFAESLWYEWRNRGVDILACCAGATSSPNFIETKPEPMGILAPRILSPKQVVDECFFNLGKQPSIITGLGNRIANFFMQRFFPRKIAVKLMGDNTRKIYRL